MARGRFDTGTGPSQRQLRVGELIRRNLSDILMRGDVRDADLAGVSITVGEVRMSPDLRVATVFVLPLGGANVRAVIKALARSAPELRRAINRSVKLKFSPELRFLADDTFDRMDETRAMLGQERVQKDLHAPDIETDD
ncbi:MAG: 30S ribosome-binding factor RbfA [Pseudomonadota bacterium]